MSVVKKRVVKAKPQPMVINPSFRLIDFHFQDEKKGEIMPQSSVTW